MQIVSSVNFIFLFLTDIGGRYGCEKLLNFQDAEEEGEFQAKSHLEPSFKQIHKRISVAGVFERRRARRFQARNVGRIDQTLFRGSNNRGGAARRGAVANASMQLRRSSFAPFRSSRIYKAKRPLRKQLTLFPSPGWYWPLRYFTVMFNNSQTVRWRKPL